MSTKNENGNIFFKHTLLKTKMLVSTLAVSFKMTKKLIFCPAPKQFALRCATAYPAHDSFLRAIRHGAMVPM